MRRLPIRPVVPLTKASYSQAAEFLHGDQNALTATVFCSDRTVNDRRYDDDAKEFGTRLGQAGHNLVWGGSPIGMMRSVSEAAKAAGSKLVGVAMFGDATEARHGADIMLSTQSLNQRKQTMISLGHVSIALPGGLGSLGEISTLLEMKKSGYPLPPVILLNTGGFYNGLYDQVDHMHRQGFLDFPTRSLISLAGTPEQAVAQFEMFASQPQEA